MQAEPEVDYIFTLTEAEPVVDNIFTLTEAEPLVNYSFLKNTLIEAIGLARSAS